MPFIISLLAITLLALVWNRWRCDRRRRRIASITHRHRTDRLNRTLKLTTPEPLTHRPPKASRPAASEFQRILADLRQTHPHKSEAWRWDEAHRILAIRANR